MKPITLFACGLFSLFSLLTMVSSKCCRRLVNTYCGDGTKPSPCCGWGLCNGFCCDCQGMTAVASWTAPSQPATLHVLGGKTWTCRDNHASSEYTIFPVIQSVQTVYETEFQTVTANVKREVTAPSASASGSAAYSKRSLPTLAPAPRSIDEEADDETYDLLMSASDGTGKLTQSQFLAHFGAIDGSDHGNVLVKDFKARDRDNDGYLNYTEISYLCSHVKGEVVCVT